MNSAAAEHAQAYRLISNGDYAGAMNRVLQLLAKEQDYAPAWDTLARLQLQFGDVAASIESASAAVRLQPMSADSQYTLGRSLKAAKRVDEAAVHYRHAIELDPTRAQYFCSLGVACHSLGRLEEAVNCYQAALALEPENREAKHNLAIVLREAGRLREATGLAPAMFSLSEESERLFNEAATLHSQGDYKGSMQRWTEVLRLAPRSAIALHGYAAALNALRLFDDALDREEQALAIDPDHLLALDGARKLAQFAGEVDKARQYGQRLLALQPSDATRIATELALPVVHESLAAIAQTREHFESALDELRAMPLSVEQPDETVGNLSFYLAYHGKDNRVIQGKLGRLMIQACPDLTWQAKHCRDYRRGGGRLRIGFASELLKNHSIGRTSSGLIAELDRERFEVYTLNLPGSATNDDRIREFIRGHSDHWLQFSGNLEKVRREIADLKLDILFYQDIGMTPFSYFLAYSRLAPVQCVSFGHPDTTGVPNLDYFVSNDLYEPDGAQQHYTERLVALRDLPTLAYYYRPEQPQVSVTRSDWGFAETDHLYLCAQTLFKLHPDFDELLAGILARDPRAHIVLIDGQTRCWRLRLEQRFAQTMGELARRISFINRVDGARYLALLKMVDVVLDTIHFNGMNSSLEAFAMGTPVVTWPKHLQRGRHTQAMYRQMQMPEMIAADAAGYIDLAVRLGTEPDYRRSVGLDIEERSGILFENRRVVEEFGRFFESALAETTDRPPSG
jgi:predicted O-linked N-acetylglucosamine transferase (SPINDLY family)